LSRFCNVIVIEGAGEADVCTLTHVPGAGHSDAQGSASECPDLKNYK